MAQPIAWESAFGYRPRARGDRSVNYARRQQYRRLSHAGEAAPGSVIAALLGLVVASAGAAPLAGLLLLTAVGLGLYARHWLSLAGRSRVGARSEDEVQRALAPLQAEGWRLRHSLRVAGPGRHRLGGDRAHRDRRRDRDEDQDVRRVVISLGCASRRRGCRGAGEDGHATAPSASCASSVRGASSVSRMTFWWSRSTG